MQKSLDGRPPTENSEELLARLLRESAEIDSMVDSIRVEQVASDRADLEAIKKLDQEIPRIVPRPLPGRGLRAERNRLRVLLAIAGTLFVACVVAYIPLLTRNTPELRIPLSELPNELEVLDAMEVGAMLYATVAAWSWQQADEAGRIAGIDNLAAAAAERGIRSVLVTDENKVQLAVWGREDGVKLAELKR